MVSDGSVQNEFDEVRAMLVEPTSDILSVRHVRSQKSTVSVFFWQPFIKGLLNVHLFFVCTVCMLLFV